MRNVSSVLSVVIAAVLVLLTAGGAVAETNVHSFSATSIDGEEKSLADYKGKVLLIVNTASKCGFTGQYEGLQELYAAHKDDGLVVLGFPSNDYLGQEPGTNEEIKAFCSTNYGVEFDMFAKIHTKGDDIHPLYAYLTEKSPYPGKISWNFNKFLVNRDGEVVARYGSRVKPQSEKLLTDLKKVLGNAAGMSENEKKEKK